MTGATDIMTGRRALTPAASRLASFLAAYNTGDLDVLIRFAVDASEPEALARHHATAWHAARYWHRAFERYGAIEPLEVRLSLPHRLVVRGGAARGGPAVQLDIGVMPDAPHRIYQLAVRPEVERLGNEPRRATG